MGGTSTRPVRRGELFGVGESRSGVDDQGLEGGAEGGFDGGSASRAAIDWMRSASGRETPAKPLPVLAARGRRTPRRGRRGSRHFLQRGAAAVEADELLLEA